MMSQDNESGTMTKPPRLSSLADYASWKDRFEAFLSVINPAMNDFLIIEYVAPIAEGCITRKSVFRMTDEEKREFDIERKTYALLTMALSKDIFRSFQQHKTSKSLWEALAKRCEGTEKLKRSKRH